LCNVLAWFAGFIFLWHAVYMLTSELTDEQLARLAAADNVAALEELVARYLKPVYGFVRSFVYDADVADDITQEVFVKVWKHISRYDTEQPFRPWLYIIAKRTTFDFLKKKRPSLFLSWRGRLAPIGCLRRWWTPRQRPML
jgi:hypothetical protein